MTVVSSPDDMLALALNDDFLRAEVERLLDGPRCARRRAEAVRLTHLAIMARTARAIAAARHLSRAELAKAIAETMRETERSPWRATLSRVKPEVVALHAAGAEWTVEDEVIAALARAGWEVADADWSSVADGQRLLDKRTRKK